MADFGNGKRNADILKLVDTKRLSYEVIAEMMGVTRCAVAGVVFRRRYPPSVRIDGNGKTCGSGRTKMGHGWRPQSYFPEKTAANTR